MTRSLQLAAAEALSVPNRLVPKIHLQPEVLPAKNRGMVCGTHFEQRAFVTLAGVTSEGRISSQCLRCRQESCSEVVNKLPLTGYSEIGEGFLPAGGFWTNSESESSIYIAITSQ